MLDHDTKIRLLQHYPMLGELPAAELDDLLSAASLLPIPEGTVLFDENQSCQGFPLLLSGVIRVIKAEPNGRELLLYHIISGESCILTSCCLLGYARYQARGIAEMPLKLVMLPASGFHTLLGKSAGFRNYVFHLFSERITELLQLLSSVAFQKLDQRLAKLLINKSTLIHITHQALADELGSAREIVSRQLKVFADQGWVKLGREQIEILDRVALKKFSEH